jgi:hypothetical protein
VINFNNPFFNSQMIQQSIMAGLRQQQQMGAYNNGFQDGVAAGQANMLSQLGLLPSNQISQFQSLLGGFNPREMGGFTPGIIPQPQIGMSGPPAGKGLEKNPAGWPEGSVRTAGGYTVVPEGNTSWKVFGPDQKPGDKPVTHVSGDPHVDQKDGTRWDFTKNSDFVLPDGTRINCKTSSEKGYSVSTGLEITNGADRVSVSGLDGKASVGDVTHDGYEWRAQHLAENPNRDTFRLGGDGDDWFLERNGQDLGKITGANMDAATGAYVQHTDGKPYNIDPNLRPPVGSDAWGNMLRGESLDRVASMGLDPATAGMIGQMFHADHSTSQYQQGLEQLSQYMGPFGALRMLFQGPGDAFAAVGKMGDALNSLMSLEGDMLARRTTPDFGPLMR